MCKTSMVLKVVNIGDTGSSVQFGADDVDKIDKILSGIDLSATETISIATAWKFQDQKLKLQDPTNTRSIIVKTTSGMAADRQAIYPALSANDTHVFANQAQTLTNKTMDYNSNTFTNFPAGGGSGDMVLANVQTITGAKTFNDTKLLLRNPANTFSVTLGAGAQTAGQTFTFPVTTSDTILTAAATQTVTNKTISGSANTVTNIPKSAIPSTTLYNDVDNSLGVHYLALSGMTAPGSPAAGTVRVYADTADTHLKVKHPNGSVTDLDALGTTGGGTVILSPTYMIYIDGAGRVNALNGITNVIDYSTASAPATITQTTSVFQNVFTALQSTGGLVFIKRGTYIVNASLRMGTTSSPSDNTIVAGEGYDATILQHDSGTAAFHLLRPKANFIIRNLTLDGQGVSGDLILASDPSYGQVIECHFLNGGSNGVECHTYAGGPGPGNNGILIDSNWFDKTGLQDQVAIGSSEYAVVANNFFDKRVAGTSGSTSGSCLTAGGATDYLIAHNVFKRLTTDIGAAFLTIEPRLTNYERIVIDGNTIVGGTVLIGGSNWSTGGFGASTYRNVTFCNNVIRYGRLSIQGDPTNDPGAGSIQQVNIVNNIWSDSYWSDVDLRQVSGPLIFADNQIRDSNKSDGTGGDRGLVYVEDCNNIDAYGNYFHLTDNSTANTSSHGFRIFGGCTNVFFHDNKFLNPISRPTFVLDTFGGANSNVKVWDNEGYVTDVIGVTQFNGDGSTTAFNVTHGVAVTPTIVTISTNLNNTARVSAISSTTFTVTFNTAPASGTNNVTVYWRAAKRVLA